jgi:hypothetical protein
MIHFKKAEEKQNGTADEWPKGARRCSRTEARKFGQERAVKRAVPRQEYNYSRYGPIRHLGHVRSRPARMLRPGMDARLFAAIVTGISDLTRMLSAIEQGDPHAASKPCR